MKGLDETSEEEIASLPRGLWGANLSELVDVLTAYYKRTGKAPSEAFKDASVIAILLAKHLGGKPFYLPMGKRLQAALRDEEIYRANNGRNAHELAERYGMSLRMVQLIIARQHDLQRKKRKGLIT